MIFYMPVKVFEEKDCVLKHSEELCALGTKALLVTGAKSARINGSFDDVAAALKKCGKEFVLFDKIEENPSVETVMAGRDFGVKNAVDFVIGIGGGSALDAAKAIALMIKHKDCSWEYMYKKGQDSSSLPLAAIPTTCGTGSEVTGVSVLTDNKNKKKGSISHKIFPQVALIDGKYLLKAPVHIIQLTALDALTHLYESYANSAATVYSRMTVSAGLAAWSKIKGLLLSGKNPSEEEAFCLMEAAAFAGMAIAQTGTSLPHALSYALTYNLKIPHGIAVGYFTAGYLNVCPEKVRDYLLKNSSFKDLEDFSLFYKNIFGASLPKIQASLLDSDVQSVATNSAKLATAPFAVDFDCVNKIAHFYS